jgi:transketolase C-terminal domain/subunit
LINVGIAEQAMVGVGAGLANGGKVPFVSGASCFLTARALEQIKADVAYTNTNVKLCGMSSGVAYGELGPTHHSIEDFAWLRLLPNLTIIAPSDRWETEEAVKAAAATDGPFFLRISRMPVPDLVVPLARSSASETRMASWSDVQVPQDPFCEAGTGGQRQCRVSQVERRGVHQFLLFTASD